jgi:uridine phosphorylase
MSEFPETELILTNEGRIYHLNLREEDVASKVILVGDPGRVAEVSSFFSHIDFRTQHREFVTHTGNFNGERLSVTSTGIGTDNIDIVMNELDAAVNIDPLTRELRKKQRRLDIYRLGTSGSLQKDVPVDSIVLATHALGIDGLLPYYEGHAIVNEADIVAAFTGHMNWTNDLPRPHCVKADAELFTSFGKEFFSGITITAPGFYGPQGRKIRLAPIIRDLNERIASFSHCGHRIINFEMESSAMYGLGKMLGHRCLTACVIIANRPLKKFTSDYKKSVHLLIETSLQKITSLK